MKKYVLNLCDWIKMEIFLKKGTKMALNTLKRKNVILNTTRCEETSQLLYLEAVLQIYHLKHLRYALFKRQMSRCAFVLNIIGNIANKGISIKI